MVLALAWMFPKGSSLAMIPAFAGLGFLLGLAVWDAPNMPPAVRALSPAVGIFLYSVLLMVLEAANAKETIQALGFGKPYLGLLLLAAGIAWSLARRTTGGFLMVAGAGLIFTWSLTTRGPEVWPLIPVFLLTYVPLFYWDKMDNPTRIGAFLGNIAVLAPLNDALPVNAFGTSWILVAIPLLYLMAIAVVHWAEDRRALGWWLGALAAVTLYMAFFAEAVWLRWLPVPELSILLVLMGAMAHLAGPRMQTTARVVIGVLALAHGVLSLSTLVARVRINDPVWESIVLFFFSVALAVWAIRPQILWPKPQATPE